MTGRKGVTLLELLMVVVIIGILGAVAIPQYIKMAERSRTVEARDILLGIRGAQAFYYSRTSSYASSLSQLDFDAGTSALMGALKYFGGPILSPTPANCDGGATTICTNFSVSMARNNTEFSTNSGCNPNYTVTATPAGVVSPGC